MDGVSGATSKWLHPRPGGASPRDPGCFCPLLVSLQNLCLLLCLPCFHGNLPRAGRQFSKASYRKLLASSSTTFRWSACRDSSGTLLLGAQGEEKKCPGERRAWLAHFKHAVCFLPTHCLSLRASLPKCQLPNFSLINIIF